MATIRRETDGREVLLSTEHVVGRMRSSSTALGASFISLAHALLRWSGSAWEVRDLGSTNGTFVDGRRLDSGESARLYVGTTLRFGGDAERWTMLSDSAPNAAAIPLDGGEPSFLASGVLPIFDGETLLAAIYQEREHWYLEVDDVVTALAPGQRFTLGGRAWRFDCPSIASATATIDGPGTSLDDVVLEFEHSSDEEHVTLAIAGGPSRQLIRERACLYLALVLARSRLDDQRKGLSEHGWVRVDDLLKMIPDYGSASALNVEIFRLRRLFSDAGVRDAPRIIERRRGEMRLGTGQLVVRRRADDAAQIGSELR